jgi:3-hydroxybutyrate dehydrogenase
VNARRNAWRGIRLCKAVANEGAEHAPLVDRQIPEQAKELGASEQHVIKHVMLKEMVDGQFTTTDDVADAALFSAGARSNALTGQSKMVSHGWFMQ